MPFKPNRFYEAVNVVKRTLLNDSTAKQSNSLLLQLNLNDNSNL